MTAKLYKAGDRVRIKTEQELLDSGWEDRGVTFDYDKTPCYIRKKYAGMEFEIVEVLYEDRCYRLSIDWHVGDEAIAGKAEAVSTVDNTLDPVSRPISDSPNNQVWSKEAEMFGKTELSPEMPIREWITQIAQIFYFNGSMDGGSFSFNFESDPFRKYTKKKYDELMEIMKGGK